MGPRKFVAKRLTDFLLHHGSLDVHVVRHISLDQCLELQSPVTTVPWWKLLTYSDDLQHQMVMHHSVMLLLSSFVITYNLEQRRKWRRKGRLFTSAAQSPSKLWKRVGDVPLYLARISLCLAALSIIFRTQNSFSSTSHVGNKLAFALRQIHFMNRIISSLEGIPVRSDHLQYSSLWAILTSTIIQMSCALWSMLDPRIVLESTAMKVPSWRDCLVYIKKTAGNAAATGIVIWLAYIDLPLFHKMINGEIQISSGLPPGLIQMLQQTACSFIGFCIFNKLFPKETTAKPTEENIGIRKTKKHICDPAIVRRMSALANEARERVQARNKNGRNKLRRCCSEANFNISTPPPPKRSSLRSSLTSRPGRQYQHQPPKSPLMDIHLAGPTLSSKDLLAKLKENECMLKHSASSGCLEIKVPESILITVPSLPNLAEEEKVLEDVDEEASRVSTPVTHVTEESTMLTPELCVL